MTQYSPLSSLDITNQCVVVCDLGRWSGPDAPAWQSLKGSQDEVGQALAAILDERGLQRIDDFGGVCKTFLCDGEEYRDAPPRVVGSAGIFSFTPKKRLVAEALEMAKVAAAAGYRLLVLTLQKHDKFGKVWVLCGLLRHWKGNPLTYFEDTDTVVDELKATPEGQRVSVVHVQAPGYEHCVSRLADRRITQDQYQREVLQLVPAF